MAKTLMVNAGTSGSIVQNNTRYFVLANAAMIAESSEANALPIYQAAGVMSMMRTRVTANSTLSGTPAVLRVRKNSADQTLVVTPTFGTTGDFEDTTNSDSIGAGSAMSYSLAVPAAASGAITLSSIAIVFAATTDTVIRHAATNFAAQANADTRYCALCDNCVTIDNTGTTPKFNCNSTGIIENMHVYVSAWVNTLLFTSTITTAQNAGLTGLTVSPTGTGDFQDTTNQVTVVANDDIYHQSVTTGVGSITMELVSVEWVSTNKKFHSVFGRTGSGMGSLPFGLTRFCALGGGSLTTATEADAKTKMRMTATVTNLTCRVAVNTIA